MDTLVIFLVMFATIIGPTLAIFATLVGLPVTLVVLKKRGMPLTAKVVLIAIAAILALPLLAEGLAVLTLVILFTIFGQG